MSRFLGRVISAYFSFYFPSPLQSSSDLFFFFFFFSLAVALPQVNSETDWLMHHQEQRVIIKCREDESEEEKKGIAFVIACIACASRMTINN